MADRSPWEGDPRDPTAPADISAPSSYGGRGGAPMSYGMPGAVDSGSPSAYAPGPALNFPPDYYPPPSAQDIMVQGVVTGATGAAWQTIATEDVPVSSLGVLRDVEFTVAGTIALTSVLRFRVVVNSMPVPGWSDIRILGRSAASVSLSFLPESVYIRLPEASSVRLQYALDASSYNILARARGWVWGQGGGA